MIIRGGEQQRKEAKCDLLKKIWRLDRKCWTRELSCDFLEDKQGLGQATEKGGNSKQWPMDFSLVFSLFDRDFKFTFSEEK